MAYRPNGLGITTERESSSSAASKLPALQLRAVHSPVSQSWCGELRRKLEGRASFIDSAFERGQVGSRLYRAIELAIYLRRGMPEGERRWHAPPLSGLFRRRGQRLLRPRAAQFRDSNNVGLMRRSWAGFTNRLAAEFKNSEQTFFGTRRGVPKTGRACFERRMPSRGVDPSRETGS
jgi:hypothetical protein